MKLLVSKRGPSIFQNSPRYGLVHIKLLQYQRLAVAVANMSSCYISTIVMAQQLLLTSDTAVT